MAARLQKKSLKRNELLYTGKLSHIYIVHCEAPPFMPFRDHCANVGG